MKFDSNSGKKLFFTFLIMCCASALMLSCRSSDKIEVEFRDGISIPIWELVGDDIIFLLENELEFPIYRGDDPPNVEEILLASSSSPGESTVIMSPNVLAKTNVPNDAIRPGGRFREILIRLRNQDMKRLTIDFDRVVLGSSPFLGEGSHIIGNENQFTVFGRQEDIVQQDTIISVNFFSGIVEDGGIASAKGGIIVVENGGIGIFIPTGTGRLFEDEDGFAELDKWPSTGMLKLFVEQEIGKPSLKLNARY